MYFINQLTYSDFKDLLISVNAIQYDNRKQFEYVDMRNYIHVHIWDNTPHFKDREADLYFDIDDYNTTKEGELLNYYLFMLDKFDTFWYKHAKKYLENQQDYDRLEILEQAKKAYEREIEIEDEIMQDINNGL
ncbi:MAG: hypothetical protein IKM43_03780 [Clostridia bacterium]|nr:hypothetical protein [Clostridia bacterium]